jgi:hypothetical protein
MSLRYCSFITRHVRLLISVERVKVLTPACVPSTASSEAPDIVRYRFAKMRIAGDLKSKCGGGGAFAILGAVAFRLDDDAGILANSSTSAEFRGKEFFEVNGGFADARCLERPPVADCGG